MNVVCFSCKPSLEKIILEKESAKKYWLISFPKLTSSAEFHLDYQECPIRRRFPMTLLIIQMDYTCKLFVCVQAAVPDGLIWHMP